MTSAPKPFVFKLQAPTALRVVIAATYAAAIGAPKVTPRHPRPGARVYDGTREGSNMLAALRPMAETPEDAAQRRAFWIAAAQAAETAGFLGYNPIAKRRHIMPDKIAAARAQIMHWSGRSATPVSITDYNQMVDLLSAQAWLPEYQAWCAHENEVNAYAATLAAEAGLQQQPGAPAAAA
jgi:hypothetical protein